MINRNWVDWLIETVAPPMGKCKPVQKRNSRSNLAFPGFPLGSKLLLIGCTGLAGGFYEHFQVLVQFEGPLCCSLVWNSWSMSRIQFTTDCRGTITGVPLTTCKEETGLWDKKMGQVEELVKCWDSACVNPSTNLVGGWIYLFVGSLFYVLAISKVISGWTPICDI